MRRFGLAAALSALAAALAGCGASVGAAGQPGAEAAGATELRPLGEFRVTCYWVAEEKDFPGGRTEEIPGLPGRYAAGFRKALLVEGTGRLLDGRTVNAAGGGRFAFTEAKWGLGCGGEPLRPFRSIATDPAVISTGSVVRLAVLAGLRLPDGSVHDGVLTADDVGSGISGRHIDVFIGERSNLALIERRVGAGPVKLSLVRGSPGEAPAR